MSAPSVEAKYAPEDNEISFLFDLFDVPAYAGIEDAARLAAERVSYAVLDQLGIHDRPSSSRNHSVTSVSLDVLTAQGRGLSIEINFHVHELSYNYDTEKVALLFATKKKSTESAGVRKLTEAWNLATRDILSRAHTALASKG
jgi:hypothetical protein